MAFYLLAGLGVFCFMFLGPSFTAEAGGITDFLTMLLVILSFLIGGLMMRGRWGIKIGCKNNFFYVLLCILMVSILLVTFKVSNLLYFYVFFEAGLIPIFLLILG